ncbi:MAG: trimeric intracellular cation channel family protein [Actinobacteria bacterium]|nr:trimeric intracellular cation channel family protein [Actinomycetota bacterium]MCG2801421.1 trimeric intracellular cation channel family protein [Cellulomonas sp.]
MTVTDPSPLLEVVGVVAFAVSGAAVAIRARMDWVGVAVLAAVTAVGGGTLRDLLLGRFPIGWVADPWPVWVAIGTAVVVIAQAHLKPRSAPDETLVVLIADAAGLAVFTVASTLLALASGASAPVAVLIGAVTGTGGGIARDVLARQRPLVLVGQVYALTAVGGATLLVVLHALHAPTTIARWSSVAVVFVLRLAAIRFSWSLPRAPQLPSGPTPPTID